MQDNINIRYKQLHDIFCRDYMGKKALAEKLPYIEQEMKNCLDELSKIRQEKEVCERKLSYYENGKLYRLMKKVYIIAFKVLRR